MTDSKRVIKIAHAIHRRRPVQKNLRDPRDQDQDENENVIAFQPSPDRLEFADLERRQNQIFADQFFPFALQHVAIFHHHRDEKMRFEHAHPRAKRVVKTVTARLDPEHHPDDREIEKENDVRHFAIRKRDRDDGGAARDRPVRGDVEPLPPDHDAPKFAAVKMRHRIDVTRDRRGFSGARLSLHL